MNHYEDSTVTAKAIYTRNLKTNSEVQTLTSRDIKRLLRDGYAVHEVMEKDEPRCIYLDIENVDVFDPRELILNLSKDFSSMWNLEGDITITANSYSRHPGYSFHIIYDTTVPDVQVLRDMVYNFKQKHPEYDKYVDMMLYSDTSKLRVPYSYNAAGWRYVYPSTGVRHLNGYDPAVFRMNERNISVREPDDFHYVFACTGKIHMLVTDMSDCHPFEGTISEHAPPQSYTYDPKRPKGHWSK